MDISKLGQAGRLCIWSCLLLTALLFAGCQTNKAESGFSEVPGMQEATAATAAKATPPPAALPSSVSATGTNETAEIIKPGQVLVITFSDLPPPPPPAFDQRVRDDGKITLIYNHEFQAAGKRTGDLEKEIRDYYVPGYFQNLTVTVRISTEIFYFVEGEVKMPNQYPYRGPITVSKAIATAGGFTDFANKRKVKLIRSNHQTQTVNCNKVIDHPELDPPVLPDDKIHVSRRLF
jgi:protein involved in polysaccharide export with SLBB domain